jgi:hypothetical protein
MRTQPLAQKLFVFKELLPYLQISIKNLGKTRAVFSSAVLKICAAGSCQQKAVFKVMKTNVECGETYNFIYLQACTPLML